MSRIRLAGPEDASALLDIYSYYVEKTCASFEQQTPSTEEFAERIRNISAVYPYLVYEADGKIVGYAYSTRYAVRVSYCYDVEVSIYVHESFHSKGVAKKLYDAMFELLAAQGLYNAYSGITVPNEKSRRFHEKCGFEHIGQFPDAGYKHGEWHDVEWMAKKIQPLVPNPEKPKTVKDLSEEFIEKVLEKYN